MGSPNGRSKKGMERAYVCQFCKKRYAVAHARDRHEKQKHKNHKD